MRKKILIFLILAVSFFPRCNAQENTNQPTALTISPAIIEAVLTPDTLDKTTIRINNSSRYPIPIKAFPRSFLVTDDLESNDLDKFDASSWITLNPADFILQPDETKEVEVSILPDKFAEAGGHYATIYFQPLIPENVLSSESTFLSSRVGALAFFIVKGEVTESAKMTAVKYSAISLTDSSKIQTLIENTGNVHLMPQVKITAKNKLTNKVSEETLKPTIVLPETTKVFEHNLTKSFPIAVYDINIEVKYGSENKLLLKEIQNVVVFPLLPVIFVIILLTGLIYFFIVYKDRLQAATRVLLNKEDSGLGKYSSQKPKSTKKPANEKNKYSKNI